MRMAEGRQSLDTTESSFGASEVPRRIRSHPFPGQRARRCTRQCLGGGGGSESALSSSPLWQAARAGPDSAAREGDKAEHSPVIQSLQEVRAQTGARSTGNGVAKHKSLEGSRT